MNFINKIFWRYRFNKKNKITLNMSNHQALKILDDFLPGRLKSPSFTHTLSAINICVDLMIVIPVYNSENYLKRCIESVLNQKTQFTYKVVLVNDGSTDNSLQILRDYENNPCVEVIDMDNHGVSAARNIALSGNLGHYIMFVDSDDYLDQDAVEKLMTVAKLKNADIVEGGHTEFDEVGHSRFVGHCNEIKCAESKDLFGFPWGKIIKGSCMNNICFPENYCYEDTIMAFLVHTNAKCIYTIPDNILHYRITHQGRDITTLEKNTVIDTFWMTKYCLEELMKRDYEWNRDLEEICFNQFHINWLRLNRQDVKIQKSVFCLTCELFDKYFLKDKKSKNVKKVETHKLLKKVLENKSYEAYLFLMQHWDILDNRK